MDATTNQATEAATPAADAPLLELLQPWRATMSSFFSVTQIACVDNTSDAATATLQLSNATPADPIVRQTIELLSVATLLDATLVRSLVEGQWLLDRSRPALAMRLFPIRTSANIEKVRFTILIENALRREVPLDATLAAVFDRQPTSVAHVPSEQQTTFERAREELQRRVVVAGKNEQLQQLRVGVSCNVLSTDRGERRPNRETDANFNAHLASPEQAKALFDRTVSMIKSVTTHEPEAASNTVKLALTGVHLQLKECFPITSDVVRAAQALAQFDIVRVPEVTLDPRLISCSSEELTAFVHVLGRNSREFRVDTGYTPDRNLFTAIDEDGTDKRELIVMMMKALAACADLVYASVGGLLSLLTQPHNRRHFWEALLEILLAPVVETTNPRKDFYVYMYTELTEDDAAVIQSIPDLATRARRPIDRFYLLLGPDSPDESILQAVALVRDMEMLDFGINVEVIPEPLTRGVLQLSSKLRSVRINHAEMSSMSVLTEPTGSGKCLDNIELFMPRDVTQQGLTAFLTELLDPSTPLATSLRRLDITSFGPNVRNCELDTANAELLERVLRVNRQLLAVHVPLHPTVPQATREALKSHTGDAAWWSPRVPEFAIEERCAFLSVVRATAETNALSQLDSLVIHRIFEFSRPFKLRCVFV